MSPTIGNTGSDQQMQSDHRSRFLSRCGIPRQDHVVDLMHSSGRTVNAVPLPLTRSSGLTSLPKGKGKGQEQEQEQEQEQGLSVKAQMS